VAGRKEIASAPVAISRKRSPHPHRHVNEPSSTAHVFSVDVEEHFQVSAFESVVERSDWDHHASRVESNTRRLVDLLQARGAVGTFFVLGWVAQRHPDLVRHIHAAGNEIASHGFWHRRVPTLEREQFREDVRISKQILEDIVGESVAGYRAPSFSIVPGTEWALDVLIEEGYRYDSSLFPIQRRGYGYPDARHVPHTIVRPSGRIRELPLTTVRIGGRRWPAAGGAYFRHFPYAITRAALRSRVAKHEPGVFYIHPWEIDPEQPRLRVSAVTRLRHYGGIARAIPRLEQLLKDFRFTSVAKHEGIQEVWSDGAEHGAATRVSTAELLG
jgi:polysaccharide deacetylase family protein (PEP-CTERM system associated)